MFFQKYNFIIPIYAIFFAFISSCIPEKQFVDLTQQKDIAFISFALNKTISLETDTEVDQGPGLLQKAFKGKEKATDDYFKYHQEALDNIWTYYQQNIQDALLGISMVSTDKIVGNEKLLSITKPKKKIIMGTDISISSHYLNPEGLNYVGSRDLETLDKICNILNTNLLLLIEHKADHEELPPDTIWSKDSLSIFKITPVAKIHLETTVYIHEKGKGLVVIENFDAKSDDKMKFWGKEANPENYPKLIMQASKKIIPQIKKTFLYHKKKAYEQNAAGI